MSLFQNSVLNKYLRGLDTEKVDEAYKKFTIHFHNPVVQENIRNSKEEQYQGGFLIDLFVNVLGYIKNPTPAFNITTELKNVKDSKKTDGAIVIDGKVLAVIELKGTNTTDLSKVEAQAFGYKNNQLGCNYVITSNFEKLRFYIDNAVDFEEFNLFQMTRERFNILWLCISAEYLLKNLPKKIKDESLTQEENITVQLYKDYAAFRNDIFGSIQKENPEHDKLTLFKKTQKLLDRFLFIFFAEDRLLLPPNSIRSIVNQWKELQYKYDEYFPLYDRFNKFFGYMNTGHKGHHHEIFAYNGGLFAPDEVLDNIKIDDDILYKHTLKLSNYNYESEVDVNILGHIFEHSLNEIETIQSEIKGDTIDKSKSKRKKDGVFYTPKYITKYIVKNTVGKLCEEKKTELHIQEEEYEKERKGRRKEILKNLIQKLEDYRAWLLQITICDPACGSGAFLNQALEFLIAEHRYIDELQAKLLGTSMVMSEVENSILENNLYGVDINEESVEIAKLSLWLRTAQRGRALTSLNDNIKCGNSLIDDPAVAGDKAFDWQKEFPEIFAKGGFDVVIGNPPYVNINTMSEIHEYLKVTYSEIHTGYNDLMYYFLFKGIDILKDAGSYGVITSNYFIGNDYADKLRLFLNKHLETIVNFEKTLIFNDANVHTTLVFAKKNTQKELMQFYNYTGNKPLIMVDINHSYNLCELKRAEQSNKWLIANNQSHNIINKIHIDSFMLNEICEIEKGSTSGKNSVFTVPYKFAENNNFEKELLRKNAKNGDIERYTFNERGYYLIYTDNEIKLEEFRNISSYLHEFKEELSSRNEAAKGLYSWYRLERPRNKTFFDSKEKLLVPYRATNNRFAYDNRQFFNDGGDIRAIIMKDKVPFSLKYLLALLNSKLLDWFYGFIGKSKGNAREYFNKPLSEIPIKSISQIDQEPFIILAETMLKLKSQINQKRDRFIKRLTDNLNIDKISLGIQTFAENDFKDLVKELSKLKIKLSLIQQDEWEEYFVAYKTEINTLQNQINQTDKEIDQMVYQLYGLTEDEIKIVEEASS